MRSARFAIVVLGCAATARADWQPAAAPPVPPETENAQRTRPPPHPLDGEPAPAEPPGASGPAATSNGSVPARTREATTASDATSRVVGAGAFAAQPSAAGQAPSTGRVELAQAGASQGRLDVEALRLFPPAPPPIVPGASPEQPNTALTSFAPAPVPPPGAVLTPSASAPAPSANAAAGANAAANAAAPSANAGANATAPSAGAAVGAPASADAPAGAAGADEAAGVQEPVAADGGVEAHVPALEPRGLWSAAALFGVGATFDNTVAGVNPLGFGFGVRGDYRILPSWSLGARALYFVGGSVELPTHDVVMQSWLLAAEGAYVLDIDPLTIQPGLALGMYVRETNYRGFAPFITDEPTSISQPDTTRFYFYLAPGLNVSLPLAAALPALAPLTVGADFRLDVAFGRRVTSSIQLLAQLGLRF